MPLVDNLWREYLREKLDADRQRARRVLSDLLPVDYKTTEQQVDKEPPSSLCDNC